MIVVLDTDIISCIAKIKEMGLLERLFQKYDIYITFAVYDEIKKAKDLGYDFVDYIFDLIKEKRVKIISVYNIERMKELEELGLGLGEIESIVAAEDNDGILLSNDKKVKKETNIPVFNLEDILSASIDNKIIKTKKDLILLIEKIESKDKIILKNKAYLIKKFID